MSNEPFPQILLTNDDGYQSAALVSLAQSLSKVARVLVIAPETEQSGVSHAFHGFLGHEVRRVPGDHPFEFFAMTGTPADCTKMGLRNLFHDRPIACVISGPNRGENAGVSSLYSGTVAGAREAALWGCPGLALSLSADATEKSLSELCRFAAKFVELALYREISPNTIWNVNFPTETVSFRGYRAAVQNLSMFTDRYVERDGKYFLEGWKSSEHFIADSDDDMLLRGYATVTPMTIDQTARSELSAVEKTIAKSFGKLELE